LKRERTTERDTNAAPVRNGERQHGAFVQHRENTREKRTISGEFGCKNIEGMKTDEKKPTKIK